MSSDILLGVGRDIQTTPDDAFVKSVKGLPARMASRLAFMSRDHHVVRDFVVRELPRQDRPLSPIQIAQVTGLTHQIVSAILAELEKKLFFLVRNSEGNVSWAFPVTTSRTPHCLTFSTGEKIFGAWAEDAFATSFVQGCLRGEKMRVRLESECHHCSRPLTMDVDERLRFRVLSRGASPLIFEPDMNWNNFSGANIIHDYWNQTVFFWSEEHARDYRRNHEQPDGAYLTLARAAFAERYAQSGLFATTLDGRLQR
jgi:hypothetical protein